MQLSRIGIQKYGNVVVVVVIVICNMAGCSRDDRNDFVTIPRL
jgi:hypothetical protein